jgi:transcriptional repressor NF-X1
LQLCGRTLKCGKHTCQALCHRGPCPSCLEAVFDEISCSCGRTVLQPPQPCGTRPPECRFECTKPQTCGHPIVQHQCHAEDVPCPKCPFLVEKSCICGKKSLQNQPCWFEEVRCGLPCGKELKCG